MAGGEAGRLVPVAAGGALALLGGGFSDGPGVAGAAPELGVGATVAGGTAPGGGVLPGLARTCIPYASVKSDAARIFLNPRVVSPIAKNNFVENGLVLN